MPSNKNVELGGRDGFKLFQHGVTSYMLPKVRRINGGWWISIARQLKIFFCITKIVSDTTRAKFCDALSLLFEVHHGLRNPVHKTDLDSYQGKIDFLLTTLVDISLPWSKSQCQSIKFHWPRHWGHTRQVRYYVCCDVCLNVCCNVYLMFDLMYLLMCLVMSLLMYLLMYLLMCLLMYLLMFIMMFLLMYLLMYVLCTVAAWM